MMKKLISILLALVTGATLFAQAPEVSYDASGNKVLTGFISKQQLVTDTAFSWFAQNQQGFVPEQAAVQALKANKDSINIIVFGGTWCSDTKTLLPRFYALTDAAGFSNDRITLIGVNPAKKTIQHLTEAFGIINVPTIILMKNGREIGRVVEYGRYGMIDREIGEIITNTKYEVRSTN